MNDDQMDELLIQGVRDYNAPNAVPRDEIWSRIQEARREKAAAVVPVSVTPIREPRWWTRASVGIAAAMILAVGIGIGSFFQHRPPVATPVTTPVVATSPTPIATPDTSTAAVVRQLHDATKETDAHVRALAQADPASASIDAAPGNGTTAANQSLAYRLVVLRHLAGSEAMITSFRSSARSSARSGDMDAELKTWSRELLGTTRLLESSQASNDPVMKRLLEDLDLVISQIVQYTSTGKENPEELDLIEQSINKRGVMSKLRSTTQSRNLPAGT